MEFEYRVEIGFRGEFRWYDPGLTFYYHFNLDKHFRGTLPSVIWHLAEGWWYIHDDGTMSQGDLERLK